MDDDVVVTCPPGVAVDSSTSDQVDEQIDSQLNTMSRLQVITCSIDDS